MQLSTVDLNLLVVFEAIMNERNVTRAGRRLGLSQSAASGALARLRTLFDDPLFVRGPGGVVPTPRAEALAEPIRRGMSELRRALDRDSAFDPKTSKRVLRIAMRDHAMVLLPALLQAARYQAPHVSLNVSRMSGHDPLALFEQGVQVAVGVFKQNASSICSSVLLHDSYLTLVRRAHPLADKRLTLRRFVTAQHVLVSPVGKMRGALDVALEPLGLTRVVALVLPDWTIAAQVVSRTDYLLSGPASVCRMLARAHDLASLAVPRKLGAVSRLDLAWPRHRDQDPSTTWLRQLMQNVAKGAEEHKLRPS